MNLTLGFSPCPNDTFLFDALVHKRIDTKGYEFRSHLEDVEALNKMAFKQELDITKLSYHAFAYLTDSYQMLRSGSALGEGVGPLLVTKAGLTDKPIGEWIVAVPGEYTTAHLLLKIAFPEISNKQFILFSDIENAVLKGEVDAGVLIHENRFTYGEKGLKLIADLGDMWEKEQHIPIPLGGIAIKSDLPVNVKQDIESLVQKSVMYAMAHPEDSLPYVKVNAQEMDPEVMKKHINLYVNPFTVELGETGIAAVDRMLGVLNSRGEISLPKQSWLV